MWHRSPYLLMRQDVLSLYGETFIHRTTNLSELHNRPSWTCTRRYEATNTNFTQTPKWISFQKRQRLQPLSKYMNIKLSLINFSSNHNKVIKSNTINDFIVLPYYPLILYIYLKCSILLLFISPDLHFLVLFIKMFIKLIV